MHAHAHLAHGWLVVEREFSIFKFAILYTSSKHISQLENSHIITYAYLSEANAVHSIRIPGVISSEKSTIFLPGQSRLS